LIAVDGDQRASAPQFLGDKSQMLNETVLGSAVADRTRQFRLPPICVTERSHLRRVHVEQGNLALIRIEEQDAGERSSTVASRGCLLPRHPPVSDQLLLIR